MRIDKISVFEAYLLAVVAMDNDYEPLATIKPFMSVRFGSRAYPRAIVRALKSLESQGHICAYCHSLENGQNQYLPSVVSLESKNLWNDNAWFKATPKGLSKLEALGVKVEL